MALFDLGKLSSIVLGAIERGVKAGQSGESILTGLKEIGEGIRRADFYAAVNAVKGLETTSRPYISSLTMNAYPNISRIPKSLTKMLANFSYKVELTGFDKATGELKTTYVNVITQRVLTKQQAIDQAVNYTETNSERYPIEGASGKVVDVFQNAAGLIL